MKSSTIKQLLVETNWLRKLWLGGSLFDKNAQNQHCPEPGKEVWLTTSNLKTKNLRELSIDIYLLTMFFINQSISRRQALLNFSTSAL